MNPTTGPTSTEIITKGLHEDGHRAWGFVIYCCTYKSQTEWDEFMRRLLEDTEEYFDPDEALPGERELFNNLAITVFDDPAAFDGATAATVHAHFKRWATIAPQREQGTAAGAAAAGSERWGPEEALDSILNPIRKDSIHRERPFVRLIDKNWEAYSQYEDGQLIDCDEEPSEGDTHNEVG
ncbi:hypothetical protein HK57_00304 [Aspergillus ustus]|uniref:Uncharacterized protein n=1 Tax=Aspergillus ustus TaxID=40382 RepID=A0A0C1EGW2_ASPUT|nr:hypothetical protein HK57_00304 [Aspergillus ustus]